MAVIWAGSEFEAFGSTIAPVGYTTATDRDNNFARAGVSLTSTLTTFYRCNRVGAGDIAEMWFHFRSGATNTGAERANREIMTIFNSSGVGVMRLFQNSATAPNKVLQRWNGSAWVDIGTAKTVVTSDSPTYDFQCRINATTGKFAWWVNGVLQEEITGNTSYFAGAACDYVELAGWGATNDRRVSECIMADESLIGWRLATLAPTGPSLTNTAWTGALAEINKTVVSDATFITSATADQVETFVQANPSGPAALLSPRAVITSFRGRTPVGGIENIQHCVRIGATNYFSANETGLTTSFSNGHQEVWENNPNTSAEWTQTNLNDVEGGVRSRT